jgi:hypothetical protein
MIWSDIVQFEGIPVPVYFIILIEEGDELVPCVPELLVPDFLFFDILKVEAPGHICNVLEHKI